MSSVILVATFKPVPGHQQKVLEALEAAIPAVHEEPGCEKYALHRGLGESTDIVMIERWASPDHLADHSTSAAVQRLGAALAGHLAAPPEVLQLAAVPSGSAELGTV